MHHRAATLVALTLVSLALAGCVREEAPPTETTPTTPTTTTPTVPTSGGNGTGGLREPDVKTDKGQISGPFEKTWDIPVASVPPRAANIMFNLTGVQAGAPPTASVYLTLSDPNNKVFKTATIGLGGTGNAVSWTLAPTETPVTGTYKLKATAQAQGPGTIPSGGLANYELFALIEY